MITKIVINNINNVIILILSGDPTVVVLCHTKLRLMNINLLQRYMTPVSEEDFVFLIPHKF